MNSQNQIVLPQELADKNQDNLPFSTTQSLPKQPQLKAQNFDLGDSMQIKNVVMNSVRMNKKLHQQIIEKQYNIKNEVQSTSNKLNSLTSNIESIYSKTQHLYEEVVRQNQKTRYMVQELIKPFREQLRGKVDQTTLSARMKILLVEFDNIGHRITYDKYGQQTTVQENNAIFDLLKTQVLPVISQLSHKMLKNEQRKQKQELELQLIRKQYLAQKEGRQKMQAHMEHFRQQIQLKTNLLSKKIQKSQNKEYLNQQKTLSQLVDKLSQKTTSKMLLLEEKIQSKFDLNNIQNYTSKLAQDVKKLIERTTVEEQGSIIKQANQHIQTLKKGQLLLLENIKQIQNKLNKQQKYHQDEFQYQKTKIETLITKLDEDLQNNSPKSVTRRITKLETITKTLQTNFKITQKLLAELQSQNKHICNLLSSKANYSDFLLYVEGKADKADYKDLKLMLQSTHLNQKQTQQFLCTQSDFRSPTSKTNKKRHFSNPHRQQFIISSPIAKEIHNRKLKIDSIGGKTRYMLGLDEPHYSKRDYIAAKQKTKLMYLQLSGSQLTQSQIQNL